jgi:hypothetical protein
MPDAGGVELGTAELGLDDGRDATLAVACKMARGEETAFTKPAESPDLAVVLTTHANESNCGLASIVSIFRPNTHKVISYLSATLLVPLGI